MSHIKAILCILLLSSCLIGCASKTPTQLHTAAYRGNLTEAKRLLSEGADPNAHYKYGGTPLHSAIYYAIDKQKGVDRRDHTGRFNQCRPMDMIRLLVSHGARVEERDSEGRTALAVAAQLRNIAIPIYLMDKGSDTGAKDYKGNTLLHIASESQSIPMVKLLLSKGASVDAVNNESLTPLLLTGSPDVIKILVENGADIDHKDNKGQTALHRIAYSEELPYQSQIDTARMLLALGADIDAKSNDGNTPLHLALDDRYGGAMAALLISKGTDTSIKNNKGISALNLALRYKEQGLVELLRSGETKDSKKVFSVILRDLLPDDYIEQTSLLLANGADVNDRDKLDNTALHIAVRSCSANTVKLLIDAGADVNAKNVFGETPIFERIYPHDYQGKRQSIEGYCEAIYLQTDGLPEKSVLDVLLEAGMDINVQNKDGDTPLHLAVRTPGTYSLDITKFLITHSAKVNIRNNAGKTPLVYAVEGMRRKPVDPPHSPEAARLLRAAGGKEQLYM